MIPLPPEPSPPKPHRPMLEHQQLEPFLFQHLLSADRLIYKCLEPICFVYFVLGDKPDIIMCDVKWVLWGRKVSDLYYFLEGVDCKGVLLPAPMLEGSQPSVTPAAQHLKPLTSSGTWSHVHIHFM